MLHCAGISTLERLELGLLLVVFLHLLGMSKSGIYKYIYYYIIYTYICIYIMYGIFISFIWCDSFSQEQHAVNGAAVMLKSLGLSRPGSPERGELLSAALAKVRSLLLGGKVLRRS